MAQRQSEAGYGRARMDCDSRIALGLEIGDTVEIVGPDCKPFSITVPTMEAAVAISAIREQIHIPLVADIHFSPKLAVMAIENGADKVRINPGNIGDFEKVRLVAKACSEKNIPIRIGVNSGSLEKDILAKYGSPTPEAMVESALRHAEILERCDFNDIVISIKSSDVNTMINGYRLLAEQTNYPLHLGVTEAGTKRMGIVKSAIGIGSLLADGIGETIRVSLTADPVEEIYAAKDILSALGKGKGVKFVSCPTCGRTKINLIGLAEKVEKALEDVDKDITVAIMGCVVNGPGEAREADIGIAGGDKCAVIFKKGEVLKKVSEEKILEELLAEIDKI